MDASRCTETASTRTRQDKHQAHQPFRPRAPPLHQVQHCCGNTAAAQSTWKNTRAPAASNAPDILPTRHYLPQAAKPRVAFNATKPGVEPGHRPAAAPPPPPPRCEARNELEPAAAFRIPAGRDAAPAPRARSGR